MHYIVSFKYPLRFVNSVIRSNVEKNVIWSHISSLRYKYLKNNIGPKCSEGFISIEDISKFFEKISPFFGNESTEDMIYNISKREVNEAAKMYFALNCCPLFFEKLYWKTIYGPDSRLSMLASNIIKIVEEDYKLKAQKIFAKIISVLRFQYISIDKEEERSGSGRKQIFTRNIIDVKGRD